VCLVVSLSLVLAISVFSQATAPQSSPQALSLLHQSLARLAGGQSITDITLSGTARRIVGPDDETGTATIKELATGESRLGLEFPSGSRTEVRTSSASGPSGSWVGPDGISHLIPQHSLMTGASWFPLFTVGRVLDSEHTLSYVNSETKNNQTVEHLATFRKPGFDGAPPDLLELFQRLTRVDVFLDSTSYLPAAIRYNIHPDNDSNSDISIEIHFYDYQKISGTPVPMHIQQYVNNALALDINIQNATFNSGLTSATFSIK